MPIVTVSGSGIVLLISGAVVTESVFNIRGIGRLATDAIQTRDGPVVQGPMLFFVLIYVGINLLIDISYVLVAPRFCQPCSVERSVPEVFSISAGPATGPARSSIRAGTA